MKIPFSPPYIDEGVINEVVDTLRSGWLTTGAKVKALEEEIRKFSGASQVLCVNSWTSGAILMLRWLGVKTGDEVIVPAYTYSATALAVLHAGATPVMVDVNDDFDINVAAVKKAITSKTKAIIPVHIFGTPANMDKINEIAKKNNLYVIEDACQAIGAKYKGQMIGSLSDIACFSFFPTKNLGTYGDGGLIATNNDNLATICRALKAHGSGENGEIAYNLLNNIKEEVKLDSQVDDTVYNPKKYYNYLIGHNSRLDELHAGILNIKLNYLDEWNNKRNTIAKYYNEKLDNEKYKKMQLRDDNYNVYHMYIIQTENRNELTKKLDEAGIAYGVYYPVPLHLQKVYKNLGYKEGSLPNAEYLSKRTIAIPVDPELTGEEKEYIVNFLNNLEL